MAPPPLPVNLRCHLPTNGCDRRPLEPGERQQLNPLFFERNRHIFCLQTTSPRRISINCERFCYLFFFFVTRGAHSTVRAAESLRAALLLNKVEQWVDPSTVEDRELLRCVQINTFVALTGGAVGKFWGFFWGGGKKMWFLRTNQKGWRASPAMNAHREAHDWCDLLISKEVFVFLKKIHI